MSAKRKSLSKAIRFEVFKRDNFTCQYCGNKAPDVILECDHINPVSKGGKNETLNLITSCKSCNRGKSNKLLSDRSAIDKQRNQIEELNKREEQFKMLSEWRDQVNNIFERELNFAIDALNNCFDNLTLNEKGSKKIERLIKKHGLELVLKSITQVTSKYNHEGSVEEFEFCLKKMPVFCTMLSKPQHVQDIRYILGVLKRQFNNSWSWSNEMEEHLYSFHNNGGDLAELKEQVVGDEFYDLGSLFKHLRFEE